MEAQEIVKIAKEASYKLAQSSPESRNNFLKTLAEIIREDKTEILFQNSRDTKVAKKDKKPDSFIDRLTLSQKRIFAIADALENIASLPDPIGNNIEERRLKSGIALKKVSCPLGLVCMIFEARPNVLLDAAALAIKSGNALILKGGSDADFSNKALLKFVKKSLKKAGLPEDSVILLEPDRELLKNVLSVKNGIDVAIPRGGKDLIEFVKENSKAPIIETGASVVHAFVDEKVNLEKAVEVIRNSKVRRVSICNALDTLLVHEKIAKDFLPRLAESFSEKVEMRCDKEAASYLKDFDIKEVEEADYDREFLSFILNIKVVKDIDEAIAHIRKHSLHHTESIVSENKENINKFFKEVDSACVFANISTQFADGGEFEIGAEIGISTQKTHARGPFALEGLTSYKWILEGDGQTRDS